MVPEWRPHGLGRDLSLLEGEDPFLELRHHLTLADESQLAALPRRGRVLGDLLGELAEILACLHAPDGLRNLGPGLVLGLAASRRGDPHEDVRRLEPLRPLELRSVLLVVGLGVLIGNDLRERLGGEEGVLDLPPLGPAEARLVGLEERLRVRVAHRHLGHERRRLDVRPFRTHPLIADSVGLLDLGVRDLDAVLDERLHALAQHVPADLALEIVGVHPVLLEDELVPIEREASILLEGGNGLDAQAQLLVADRDAFALGLLKDEGLLDQLVDHLLRQPHTLGHLGGEVLLVRPPVILQVVPQNALEARGRDLLAIDARHLGGGLAALPAERGGAVEDEARGDEGHAHDQKDELHPPEVLTHGGDQRIGLLGSFTRDGRGLPSLPHSRGRPQARRSARTAGMAK